MTCLHVLLALALLGRDLPAQPPAEAAIVRPVRVCLVLDVSGSMQEEARFERMVAGVATVLAILPEDAEVAIVSFNHQAAVVAPLTRLSPTSRDALLARIEKLRPEGGTDILAGAATAVEQLGERGGLVILLSDGLQTGNGAQPQPEAVWGPVARDVTRRAGKSGAVVTTIGLGPDAGREVLGRLSRDTGGEFFPVRNAEDLVARYVELAATVGAYWSRSESGRFSSPGGEDVILVDVAKAPPRLFRLVGGRPVSVTAAYRVERSGVRAERFRLEAGEYRFDAADTPPPTLLRPMVVRFKLPGRTTLAANRGERVDVRAVSGAGKPALKGLTLTARVSVDDKPLGDPVSVVAGEAGMLSLAVRTPARTGQLRAALEAEQDGWRHKVGVFSARLVAPPAVQVRVIHPGSAGSLPLTTVGTARSVEVPVEVAEVSAGGPPVDLLVSASDPGVRVSPERVRLAGPGQKIPLALTREGKDVPPASLSGSLRFTLASDDLTPPQIDGDRELSVPFVWSHRNPALWVRGLPREDRPVTAQRGEFLLLPIVIDGMDADPSASIRVSAHSSPPGFSLGFGGSPGRDLAAVGPSLRAETAVRVAVGRDVLPGRYRLPIILTVPDGVTLNGTAGPVRQTLTVEVRPVAVRAVLVAGGEPWSVVAPLAPVSRTVTVEVAAADGGALPDLKITPSAVGPVEVVAGATGPRPGGGHRAEYRLTVPGQSPPFEGGARFSVTGPGGVVPAAAEVTVVVPPVVVRASAEVINVPRYPGWQEAVFGWLRPPAGRVPVVRLDGPGATESGCSWEVAGDEPGRVTVALTSGYRHTVFRPGDRLHVPVREVETAIPWPVWAALAVVGGVLAVAAVRPWPLKVTLDSGRVVRALGWLRLDRLIEAPGLRLRLRRTLLGGLRLVRTDRSASRVYVATPVGGRDEVVPGGATCVAAGDRVEVVRPDGLAGPAGITVGGWDAGPAAVSGETDARWIV